MNKPKNGVFFCKNKPNLPIPQLATQKKTSQTCHLNCEKHCEKKSLKFFLQQNCVFCRGRGGGQTCLRGQYLKLAFFCWQVLEHLF